MNPDDPRHGTVAGYIAHTREGGGRDACTPCRDALARYENHRQLAILAGRPLTVPGLGTARRIQALVALGWSYPAIGRHLGMTKEAPRRWASAGLMTIRRSTAERVDQLYRELCMTLPPETTPKERESATRARRHAAKCGYVTALAWDDIDNDPAPVGAGYQPPGPRPDPNTGFLVHSDEPFDEAVVGRLLSGHKVPSNRADKVEAMRRWIAGGGSEKSFCAIHGWHPGRYGPTSRDVRRHAAAAMLAAQPLTAAADGPTQADVA